MKKNFSKFLEELFSEYANINKRKLTYFGKTITYSFAKDKVAEISLKTIGIGNHYEQFVVRIIHKINGELTRHSFPFREYLEPSKTLGMGESLIVWESPENGVLWDSRIIPKSMTPTLDAIFTYIDMYI